MTATAELVTTLGLLEGTLPLCRIGEVPAALRDGRLLVWDRHWAPQEFATSLPKQATLRDYASEPLAVLATDGERLYSLRGDLGAEPKCVPLAANAATFLTSGHVLATVKAPPAGRTYSESHRLLLLDDDLRVLDEQTVLADEAFPYLTASPTGPDAVCDFAMGQDGSLLTAVRERGGRLEVSELLPTDDQVCLAFAPDGRRVLFAPHPSDPETAMVVSWPGQQVLASVDASDLNLEMGFDLTRGYLSDTRALLLATEVGPVVTDANLGQARIVSLPGLAEFGVDAYAESVSPLTADQFAVVVWSRSGRTTTVWRLLD